MTRDIKDRLEYLRSQIEQECISYGETVELQSLAKYINPNDTLLLEWAGIPEFCDGKHDSVDEIIKCRHCSATIDNM